MNGSCSGKILARNLLESSCEILDLDLSCLIVALLPFSLFVVPLSNGYARNRIIAPPLTN
jgi:hypothetical protein